MSALEYDTAIDRAEHVASTVIREDAERTDGGQWPDRGLAALQSEGLGGLVVPREYGGLGLGLLGLVHVCERIGRECASTGLCYAMHCVGSAVLSAKASDAQRPCLEAIVAGKHLTTLALSEPGTGTHFWYPQTTLRIETDETLSINGTKSFVTNGGHADSYVLSTASAEPDAPPNHFSCVLLPAGCEGIEWGPPWAGLGLRGNESCSLLLNNVRIPRGNLLGEEGDQIWYVFNVVAPYFLMGMCGVYLGIASAAFEEARSYLMNRRYVHSGAVLGQAPVLQHRLGTLWGSIERTRRIIYHAAEIADEGAPDALPALSFAKADVAECVVNAVNHAMTFCGGTAYAHGGKLDRLLRDARAAHVMSPTTDILLLWTGRALLGEPILGD